MSLVDVRALTQFFYTLYTNFMLMKAIIKTTKGVALRDVPIPRPKASEVLIKVALAGLCRTDIYVATGSIKVKNGTILGHEFSGTVERLGRGVQGLKLGDRVAVMPIVQDANGYFVGAMLGVNSHGAFAEYACVPARLVYKVSGNMEFRKAAYAEPVAASLAVLQAPIRKDQRGIIIGASRIATLTLRIMRLRGFRSVRTVAPHRTRTIVANSCDFAIETVANAETLAEMVRIVKPKGVIVLKSRQYIPTALIVAAVVKKDLTLRGTHYGSFKEAIALLNGKKLKVNDILGPVFGLEEGIRILKRGGWEHGDRKIFFSVK